MITSVQMPQLGQLMLTIALVAAVVALVCDFVVVAGRRTPRAAGNTQGGTSQAAAKVATVRGEKLPSGLAFFGTGFTALAALILLTYLAMRAWLTGHGPFANQHEFAVSFAAGILMAYLFAEWRYRIRALSLGVLPVVIGMLVYANSLDMAIKPLVPALKNNLMLTLHVAFAVAAYGAACVSFAAAVLHLLHPYVKKVKILPSRDVLDDVGYKAAMVTFPLLTMMIVLGAVWANTAWGRYWGWDPKETAALVTWLFYGAYLHARVTRGWQGTRSSWLLIIAFASVLFAYFGNHFFGGLHSYG
ncbi:c-type cytochrome biogenesis protein CcsB [Schaalia suimastitidis]|uniref:c-type cytochrome biogenesis protein CcsB n=1 Tax=Schaalia suimastitidis TaxID=121163 RepID=UPI0003FEEFDE|nr:c-type cytochrome biogenesis protein CcsB [Schaalia suimastitidis]